MLSVKSKNYIQLSLGLIPAILTSSFLFRHILLLPVAAVISMFILIATVPLFRKRESLYMFIMVAVAGLPVNILLSYSVVSEELFGNGMINNILWGIVVCTVLFSAEEIFFGIITRLIWRRQYKINI